MISSQPTIQQVNAGLPYYQKGHALKRALADKLPELAGMSFNQWCQTHYGFGDERARLLMKASEVYDNLTAPTLAGVLPAPDNESQTRALIGLSAADQVRAWQHAINSAPDGKVTSGVVAASVAALDGPMYTRADVPDSRWPTDNDFDIPLLNIHYQADAVDLPWVGYGTRPRKSRFAGTYHFYTEDFRFGALYDDPTPIPNSGVINAVEPNFSIYDQTPRALVLERVYKKRYVARWWQACGVRIFVDLNVSRESALENLLGVPKQWRAYATRGYSDRLDDLKYEYALACERAQTTDVLFVVYGGGRAVKELARSLGAVWFADYMDVIKGRDE